MFSWEKDLLWVEGGVFGDAKGVCWGVGLAFFLLCLRMQHICSVPLCLWRVLERRDRFALEEVVEGWGARRVWKGISGCRFWAVFILYRLSSRCESR